ncbi:MAG: hypothetical protein Edafosvirus6_47 [Edafosvirus sp.]|uniref:C2H2-type domain-containing protein n=1 Tax=Edafosvirus sp. TaxID=2487765 RepID=A0A3G4ZTI3_9VIRU|nr:MAG: hypothetical protein Edafosvirus6_47 [Edafosvirus sp.]
MEQRLQQRLQDFLLNKFGFKYEPDYSIRDDPPEQKFNPEKKHKFHYINNAEYYGCPFCGTFFDQILKLFNHMKVCYNQHPTLCVPVRAIGGWYCQLCHKIVISGMKMKADHEWWRESNVAEKLFQRINNYLDYYDFYPHFKTVSYRYSPCDKCMPFVKQVLDGKFNFECKFIPKCDNDNYVLDDPNRIVTPDVIVPRYTYLSIGSMGFLYKFFEPDDIELLNEHIEEVFPILCRINMYQINYDDNDINHIRYLAWNCRFGLPLYVDYDEEFDHSQYIPWGRRLNPPTSNKRDPTCLYGSRLLVRIEKELVKRKTDQINAISHSDLPSVLCNIIQGYAGGTNHPDCIYHIATMLRSIHKEINEHFDEAKAICDQLRLALCWRN